MSDKEEIDNRLPVEIEMTLASITEGIEYWLKNVVFRDGVGLRIYDIRWSSVNNVFTITIKR